MIFEIRPPNNQLFYGARLNFNDNQIIFLDPMNSPLSPTFKKKAQNLLVNSALLNSDEAETALHTVTCGQLHGDGSNRKFFRINFLKESVCILVVPAGESAGDIAESRSAWRIGNHLRACNVPLPEIFGWDNETGILLFEDLGDIRLHDLLVAGGNTLWEKGSHLLTLYFQVIEELAHMQCAGAEGFDENWCWESSRYDQQLMLERESGYFLGAFWQGMLGKQVVPGVEEELKDIAKKASVAGTDHFLHRDFQCRNIMVKDDRAKFIDFQGGRMGPLGYDLASLLIDPYARLPLNVQGEFFDYYLASLGKHLMIDEKLFVDHYNLLAFQRNMQIVGAFAFLYTKRKKVFFADYIRPALCSLAGRLQESQFNQYPIIRNMVSQGLELVSE